MKANIENTEAQLIMVMHSNRLKEAEIYREMIENEIKPRETIITSVGQSCGPNVGPGLIAACYFGKELSEDLSVEKAICDKILQKK